MIAVNGRPVRLASQSENDRSSSLAYRPLPSSREKASNCSADRSRRSSCSLDRSSGPRRMRRWTADVTGQTPVDLSRLTRHATTSFGPALCLDRGMSLRGLASSMFETTADRDPPSSSSSSPSSAPSSPRGRPPANPRANAFDSLRALALVISRQSSAISRQTSSNRPGPHALSNPSLVMAPSSGSESSRRWPFCARQARTMTYVSGSKMTPSVDCMERYVDRALGASPVSQ
mmetsp:Transcript_38836/g.92977  ORF Transcript_38836/g.92977 Transcript_38836/m.92977 type:complete len:232 (+) Transcript_38836:595-1290(+)